MNKGGDNPLSYSFEKDLEVLETSKKNVIRQKGKHQLPCRKINLF